MKLKLLILLLAFPALSARDINWDIWNQCSWQYRYELLTIAKCNDMEPELIEAIISWESGWDTQAGQHSRYKGLMQVGGRPRQGFDCCDSMRGWDGKKWIGDVYDPYYWYDNICAGTYKLFRYINIMGSLEKGITAYHKGPAGARRWYKKHKEHPYYTKKVLALWAKMKQLKAEGDGMWGGEELEKIEK